MQDKLKKLKTFTENKDLAFHNELVTLNDQLGAIKDELTRLVEKPDPEQPEYPEQKEIDLSPTNELLAKIVEALNKEDKPEPKEDITVTLEII